MNYSYEDLNFSDETNCSKEQNYSYKEMICWYTKKLVVHICGNKLFISNYSYTGLSHLYTEVNYSYKKKSVSEMSYLYTWGL